MIIPPRRTEVLVRSVTQNTLSRLRRPFYSGDIDSLLPYSDPRVQALIWELKYYDSKFAAQLLGKLLAEELPAQVDETLSFRPLLIPIPLHPKRQKMRGYNQVERVTQQAAQMHASIIEHAPKVLARALDTPRQTELSRTKRLYNVRDAFVVSDKAKVVGRTCIVIDDVATTGSTLLEASKTLRKAGATSVALLALARTE